MEKHPLWSSGDIEVLAPEEVWALVRAAGSLVVYAVFDDARLVQRRGELHALIAERSRVNVQVEDAAADAFIERMREAA